MDIQEMKSLLYSQTDIDDLKSSMTNMENLLRLYASNQFVNSDTATISVDYSGVYPKLKMNVISVEYDEIEKISLTDVYNYNAANSGSSYPISLSFSSKMLLNIVNDNIMVNGDSVVIMLDKDLKNKQKLDIIIKPEYALYSQSLYFNMMFLSGVTSKQITIFEVATPTDIMSYITSIPETATFDDSFYLNENVYVNCTDIFTGSTPCSTGYTEIVLTEDMFKTGNTVYVQNLYFLDTSGNTIDYSDAYKVLDKVGITLTISLPLSQICGYKLVGQPRVSYYRGLQVSILRVNGDNNSSFSDRYNVTYKII